MATRTNNKSAKTKNRISGLMNSPPATKRRDTGPPDDVEVVDLHALDIRVVHVKVVGDTSLICHAWSKKAIGMIEKKQQGKEKVGKEKRKPNEEYEASLYRHPDGGHGFPAVAFKKAAVRAAKDSKLSMQGAKGAFHIVGVGKDSLVKIEGTPKKRDDMVRIGMGITNIAYRGEFKKWSAVLTIRYNARRITVEQLVNLLNTGGFESGVGEMRPEKSGHDHGMFHVELGAVKEG